jgi:hypothetical protein
MPRREGQRDRAYCFRCCLRGDLFDYLARRHPEFEGRRVAAARLLDAYGEEYGPAAYKDALEFNGDALPEAAREFSKHYPYGPTLPGAGPPEGQTAVHGGPARLPGATVAAYAAIAKTTQKGESTPGDTGHRDGAGQFFPRGAGSTGEPPVMGTYMTSLWRQVNVSRPADVAKAYRGLTVGARLKLAAAVGIALRSGVDVESLAYFAYHDTLWADKEPTVTQHYEEGCHEPDCEAELCLLDRGLYPTPSPEDMDRWARETRETRDRVAAERLRKETEAERHREEREQVERYHRVKAEKYLAKERAARLAREAKLAAEIAAEEARMDEEVARMIALMEEESARRAEQARRDAADGERYARRAEQARRNGRRRPPA